MTVLVSKNKDIIISEGKGEFNVLENFSTENRNINITYVSEEFKHSLINCVVSCEDEHHLSSYTVTKLVPHEIVSREVPHCGEIGLMSIYHLMLLQPQGQHDGVLDVSSHGGNIFYIILDGKRQSIFLRWFQGWHIKMYPHTYPLYWHGGDTVLFKVS